MSKSSVISLFVFCILLVIASGCKGNIKQPLTSVAQANSPKYTIGIEASASTRESIAKLLPKANIKQYPNLHTAYSALKVGDIDAIAYNAIIFAHTINDPTRILSIIDNDIGITEEIVIGMNKHSSIPNLKGIINSLIDSLNATGILNELDEHWNKKLKAEPLIKNREISSENVLRIATSADVPPFSFVNGDRIVGFDMDLIKILEEKLNIKAQIFKIEREKLVLALRNNEADLIVSAFKKNDDLNTEIDYSKPYYIGKTAFVVRNDKQADEQSSSKIPRMTYLEPKKSNDIYNLDNLSGKSIGVQTGTTLDALVQQFIKLPQIQYFTNIVEMTKALEEKHIEAIALDLSVAETTLKHHPNFSILKEHLNKDEFGIAMEKNNPLKARIDSCINIMKKKGEIQSIKDKWSKNKTEVRAIKQDWQGTDTLIVGTEAQYAPYEFYQSGEISGIDIDIMYTIGKMINKNIKFADMNFDVLIPSLVNEKTNLCIAAISITKERSSLIDFSIPYDKNESVIVVRTPEKPMKNDKDSTEFFTKVFRSIQNLFN